ncbi:MAG: hypothetical protein V3R96_01550 [Dehalococcoidales bacterium]
MTNKQIKPVYYPVTLLGLGLVGMALFYLVSPSLFGSMLGAFRIFNPTGAQLTTIEMQPLIDISFVNPYQLAWGNFPGIIPFDTSIPISNVQNFISFLSTSFFLSVIAIGFLIYAIAKKGGAEKSLLVVWSLVIIAATLGQRRFGYYLSVNVALLNGFLLWTAIGWIGRKYVTSRLSEVTRGPGGGRARTQKGALPITANHFIMAVGSFIILLMVFIVYAPNILLPIPGSDRVPAIVTAGEARYAPSNAWVSSLTWLKENTPEPLGNPDAYYGLQQLPPPGERYPYPESAYGVVAWWDYGYWITRIAHRIPVVNPSQNPQAIIRVASFFTAPDEDSAGEIIQEMNSPYIIIDHETALGKFWAIVTWSGENPDEYFDSYQVQQEDGSFRQAVLYTPKYYRSLAARLYNFDGQAVTPEKTLVISYQEITDEKGNLFKTITGLQQFTGYQEAETFLSSQETGNYKIIGTNPLESPVPLEALEHYRLIYSSENKINLSATETIPALKIFEYVR